MDYIIKLGPRRYYMAMGLSSSTAVTTSDLDRAFGFSNRDRAHEVARKRCISNYTVVDREAESANAGQDSADVIATAVGREMRKVLTEFFGRPKVDDGVTVTVVPEVVG